MSLDIRFCGNISNFSKFPQASVDEILSYFKDKDSIEVDTETQGRDPHSKRILSLQLGNTERQYVIDVRSINILQFKELLETKLCLLHNAKFDYKFLRKAGIVLDKIYDTMLAEVVIFNGLDRRYGLNHLCKNYLDINLPKDVRGEFHKVKDQPFTDAQIEYAGRDVAYLHKLKNKQQTYIDHFDLQYAVDVENEVVKSFADIELNGMYLDSSEWLKIANNKQKELTKLEKEMDEYLINKKIFRPTNFGEDLFGTKIRQININYSSPSQIVDTLQNLGLNVSDSNSRTLLKNKTNKFVDMLLKHRELAKKISTYGASFLNYINSNTGRIHTDFWQIKHTFRVGSGSKQMNAPNVQNIPSANIYRNCFKAQPGYSIVSIDYSSQELRLMADFSGEEKFIDALNQGKDLHCFAYNTMTGENITKEEKEKRTKAKTINFGKPYGMSPYKLSDTLDIPIKEAEELFNQYAKAFPKLNNWLAAQWDFGNKHGYILINDIHKGKRWFLEQKYKNDVNWKEKARLSGIIGRASMNTPIQGSAAIIVKIAMYEIRNWLIENNLWQNKVYMINTVHDEINFEIHNEYLHVVPKLEQIMTEVGNRFVTKVNMEVDSDIGKVWKK